MKISSEKFASLFIYVSTNGTELSTSGWPFYDLQQV